ncbi:MAG: DUF3180 domain-containing protein [Streptosporangiaceae bacterium]
MSPTRIRGLVVLAVVCAAGTWLLLVRGYSSLSPLPWTPALTLLLLAIVEARIGYLIKGRIASQLGLGPRRPGGPDDGAGVGRWGGRRWSRPLQPIAIARTVAIAKASALAAAVISGIAAGFVLDLARSLGQPIPRRDTFTALGILASTVLLAAAAVYLERSCQVPPAAHSRELERDES